MLFLEYKQHQEDHTLFMKHFVTCKLIILQVHEDDMIISEDDETEIGFKGKKNGGPI